MSTPASSSNNVTEEKQAPTLAELEITGRTFLKLTKEELERHGLKLGPAMTLVDFAKEIKEKDIKGKEQANTPKSNSGLVYVFVDNSNLFIEGKYTVGRIEQAGNFDYQRNSYQLNQLYIDHGRLLLTLLKGRIIGSNPVIVGSRPPPNDSLWDQIRFAGDGDYYPILTRALKYNWKIEAWFWSSGISGDLMRNSFLSLDSLYRHFTYAYGQDPVGKNYTLEITDGETLAQWNDDNLMECFDSLELFGWWFRKEGPTICLYFNNKKNSIKAKNWLESNHPDVRVWEVPEKRKSWS
ncbi:672_t:CDS:2 [Paraglomus brasilianum]|uniref:672_t:CDS:1 n=1 Tax=Paraglomus brasilianum TaxID=144538 RepID=A0A9N8WHC1_9GLOM|nr:672_t:CDS:2 [Paraglomus brasilianum]